MVFASKAPDPPGRIRRRFFLKGRTGRPRVGGTRGHDAAPGKMARASRRGLEGHARHAASVDAACRQNTPRADAVAQSFVARHAVRDRARPDDLAYPSRGRPVPDRFRPRRSRVVDTHQRRAFPPSHACAEAGRRVLRRAVCGAGRARARHPHQHDAVRDRRSHSVRSRPHPRFLRSRIRDPLRAGALIHERGACAFPHRLHRQGKPGAFLLGQLRSRGHAFFRTARPAPPGRRAAFAGFRRPRSLFARGVERRVLAGRRRTIRGSGVLFLRLSGAARLCGRCGSPGAGVLLARARRVHPALRGGPDGTGP